MNTLSLSSASPMEERILAEAVFDSSLRVPGWFRVAAGAPAEWLGAAPIPTSSFSTAEIGLDAPEPWKPEVDWEPPKPPKRRPRTPLGERLLAIRSRIEASGAPLLKWEEIAREIEARRGGAS